MENLRNPRVLGTQYRVYDKDGKYKRTIDKTDEKNLDESDWLKGVTCFVINEKGEVLIEVRANKGLTPGKNDLCSGHLDNDETETQAMVRELKEELGINLEESMNVVKVTQQGVPLGFESSKKTKNFFITFYCLKRNSSEMNILTESPVCKNTLEFTFISLIRISFFRKALYMVLVHKPSKLSNKKGTNFLQLYLFSTTNSFIISPTPT